MFAECSGFAEVMRNFVKGMCFLMLSNDCIVQVLGVESCVRCHRVSGGSSGRISTQSGDCGNDYEVDHVF